MTNTAGWTKEKELAVINQKQAGYVSQLIDILIHPEKNIVKAINFNSSTGTGKTVMMALLINQMPNYFFIITTLSRGQLNKQIESKIKQSTKFNNFVVYGLQDYTTATKLTAEDIIAALPKNKPVIWIRDEGHISTNRWFEILQTRCQNVINFSATNKFKNGIFCNFTETAMLRTVKQQNSSNLDDALKKLLEVKQQHIKVKDYNPCAIFRLFDEKITKQVIRLCEKYNLRWIDISEDDYIMSSLCKDNNEYDVIINKLKIVEGIDIRRAHVLFMDNRPGNLATTVQMIGRCRRNALLWRDDIDIFAPSNQQLLIDTRQCYVFYHIDNMNIDEHDGELLYELCDKISVEELTAGSKIHVDNGVMPNGLTILELENKTGDYVIHQDEATGFNYVDNPEFYSDKYVEQKFDTIMLSGGKQISASEIKENWEHYDRRYIELKVFPIKFKEIESKLNRYVYINQHWYNKIIVERETLVKKIATQKTFLNKPIQLWKNALKEQPENLVYLTEYNYIPFFHGLHMDHWKKIVDERKKQSLPYDLNEEYEAKIPSGAWVYDYVPENELNHLIFSKCTKKINCRETAIIGTDKMKFASFGNDENHGYWVEDSRVTSKLETYTKFNIFISNRYKSQIEDSKKFLFNGKNEFGFSKKYNSCLGYCVEYYAKYLLYGKRFLGGYSVQISLRNAKKNTKIDKDISDDIDVIKSCMIYYIQQVNINFGINKAFIPTISINGLLTEEGRLFVKTVIDLGKKRLIFYVRN